ncbi:aldo/keto reductase [Streptomyces poonensis]|nr:aldo/keto reductase [Streptomyces poonensis]
MRERGVQMTAWGPLGQGRADLFDHPVLTAIAEAHGKTVTQVALRWLLRRGIAVIPKTVRPQRMRENLAVFDFALTGDELAAIDALDTGHRGGPDPESITLAEHGAEIPEA